MKWAAEDQVQCMFGSTANGDEKPLSPRYRGLDRGSHPTPSSRTRMGLNYADRYRGLDQRVTSNVREITNRIEQEAAEHNFRDLGDAGRKIDNARALRGQSSAKTGSQNTCLFEGRRFRWRTDADHGMQFDIQGSSRRGIIAQLRRLHNCVVGSRRGPFRCRLL